MATTCGLKGELAVHLGQGSQSPDNGPHVTFWNQICTRLLSVVYALFSACRFMTVLAEPFLRSCQLCSHWRTSQHFMEPDGSSPCSQEPSIGPYPEPDRSSPSHLRSILILSTHLRLGLPSRLFPSCSPTNIVYAFLFSPLSCYIPCPSHPPWLDHSNFTLKLMIFYHHYKINALPFMMQVIVSIHDATNTLSSSSRMSSNCSLHEATFFLMTSVQMLPFHSEHKFAMQHLRGHCTTSEGGRMKRTSECN
jgi:hypothetical protein